MREKLVYLQKQYLKYTGGLIAQTIHPTMLTTSQILTLPYTQMQMLVLQIGELTMEYSRLEVSSIRQNYTILFWNSQQLSQIFIHAVKTKTFLHVRVIFNNVTAIAYVNNVGGIKSETDNNIGCRIWHFCIENKL